MVATDFDGVLCKNPDFLRFREPGYYEDFLKTAEPLYLFNPDIIITGRPERFRTQTEAWLYEYKISCVLFMMPFGTHDWRQIAEFKAQVYGESDARIYIESDPREAQIIKELSGKSVICPYRGDCGG